MCIRDSIGPVREVAEPDKTALLATLGSPDSFRKSLTRLVGDPSLRAELGARGRKVFEERFGIDRSADALADLYVEVAGRVAARPMRRLLPW